MISQEYPVTSCASASRVYSTFKSLKNLKRHASIIDVDIWFIGISTVEEIKVVFEPSTRTSPRIDCCRGDWETCHHRSWHFSSWQEENNSNQLMSQWTSKAPISSKRNVSGMFQGRPWVAYLFLEFHRQKISKYVNELVLIYVTYNVTYTVHLACHIAVSTPVPST